MTALLLALALAGSPTDRVDLAAVHRIKAEATRHSQVMDHLFWLTDANGPRLTGSPGYRSAAAWAVKTLQRLGGSNVHLERWGRFGRGWSQARFSVALVAPVYAPLQGAPKAWSGGTAGPVSGDLAVAPIFTREDGAARLDLPKLSALIDRYVERYRGTLRGKLVLASEERELEPSKEAPSSRFDEAKLAAEATAPEPFPAASMEWPLQRLPEDPRTRAVLLASVPLEALADFLVRLWEANARLVDFFRAEGAVAVLSTDARGDGGEVFAEGIGAGWQPGRPTGPPWVVLAPESYNRVLRLVGKKVPARVELDLAVSFDDADPDGYNMVAELPGGKKRDEVLMLGAHLDSWHAGTGATDNAAGCAVVIEAFRILKALGLPLDRTVRLALWGGEEQGLLGSRGYVREHFADPLTMKLKPEHAKLSGYFNLDNGSGKIRGIYLQGNDMARPLFEAWLAPFRDEGASTVAIRNTGGTDHESFDAVGLPGFQFIQDPLDYTSRTNHGSLDVYDHARAADLVQAAEVMATFAYQAANLPDPLPRKPLPSPLPAKKN